MAAPKTEAQIQHEILAAWGAVSGVRLWRANTGVAQMGKRTVRFGVPGQADISGIALPSGRRIELEVKTATGRQSDDQKRWERMITEYGGAYCLARSLDDADRFFASLGITR